MRVPKGTLPHDATDEVEDWDVLAARAKALAVEDAGEWDDVIAAARARAADEEREWAEAMARAKRIAGLEPARSSRVGKQPQRPPRRPARPARKNASPPPAAAPAAPSTSLEDEEAEWQRIRAQADLRLREEPPRVASTQLTAHAGFGGLSVISKAVKVAPRVVAWP